MNKATINIKDTNNKTVQSITIIKSDLINNVGKACADWLKDSYAQGLINKGYKITIR